MTFGKPQPAHAQKNNTTLYIATLQCNITIDEKKKRRAVPFTIEIFFSNMKLDTKLENLGDDETAVQFLTFADYSGYRCHGVISVKRTLKVQQMNLTDFVQENS